jgi:hypothetical protein
MWVSSGWRAHKASLEKLVGLPLFTLHPCLDNSLHAAELTVKSFAKDYCAMPNGYCNMMGGDDMFANLASGVAPLMTEPCPRQRLPRSSHDLMNLTRRTLDMRDCPKMTQKIPQRHVVICERSLMSATRISKFRTNNICSLVPNQSLRRIQFRCG